MRYFFTNYLKYIHNFFLFQLFSKIGAVAIPQEKLKS